MVKLRHKVNHGWAPDRTDPEWAARVEREAAETTARAARAVEKAEARLAAATEKAEREESSRRASPKRIARLWAVVEDRRQELLALRRYAEASPAGSQHRGRTAYRGVPRGDVL